MPEHPLSRPLWGHSQQRAQFFPRVASAPRVAAMGLLEEFADMFVRGAAQSFGRPQRGEYLFGKAVLDGLRQL